MKKTKKKSIQNGQLKALRAQQQNKFVAEIRGLFNILSCQDIFKLIPTNRWETLFRSRSYGIKIEVGECPPSCQEEMETMEVVLNFLLNEKEVALSDGQELSFRTCFAELFSLGVFVGTLQDKTSDYERLAWERLKDYALLEDSPFFENLCRQLHRRLWSLSVTSGSFELGWILPTYQLIVLQGTCFHHRIFLCHLASEKKQVTIDGIPRPAIRIGWPDLDKKMDWITIKPSDLGLPTDQGDSPMEVYIQLHALNRMKERMEANHGPMHFSIHQSLRELKFHRGEQGQFLIEYAFLGKKVGYLVATVQQCVVVIRTFLFLTCKGTPEAKKIESLTGMDKEDMKYFQLDKLGSFVLADGEENEKIRQLFTETGCQELFEVATNKSFFPNQEKHNLSAFWQYFDKSRKTMVIPEEMAEESNEVPVTTLTEVES